MAEYIEREAAIMKIMQDGCTASNIAALKSIPAADVAPVVHGRWIIGDGDDDFDVKCSVCGWTDIFDVCGIGMVKSVVAEMHYCTHCGAKIDLGGDDNG